MVRLLTAATVTVVALALGGCGGSDEQRIRGTLTDFVAAIADGDPEEACSLLDVKDKDSCAQHMSESILEYSDRERERLRDLDVTHVRVVGQVASARVDSDRVADEVDLFADEVRLRKQGGHWRIDATSL